MSKASPRLLAALGLLMVVAIATGAGYLIGGQTGLIVVVGAAELVLMVLVLAAWRDVRRAQRRLRAGLRAVESRIGEVGNELRRASDQHTRRTTDAIKAELASLERTHFGPSGRVHTALRKQFQQVEALGALYYGMRPARPIPPTRSWSASPDLLRYLYETVRDGDQRLVVECGSGVSTLVFAYGLRERGAGKVIAIEHDQHYADITRRLLGDHQLTEWAEVRVSPLKEVELAGESWPWYDLSELPDGPIDLLLVDGPPGAIRSQARFPAVPLLYERLALGGLVVVDDHDRDDERAVTERWQSLFPDLVTEQLRHEKGTLVLRRLPTT